MPGPAGIGLARAEEPGGRRAGCGVGSREPSPLADRPPHGEEALHLRDERGGQPRGAGAITAAA
jgi:hypothetical protein